MRALHVILLSGLTVVAAQRPLEFADIIEQREPSSPRLSPDGSRVAYVVRQASLERNSTKSSLWLVSPGSPARKLLDENAGLLEWLPDGTALTAALGRPGKTALWRIAMNGDASPLFEHATRIASYSWSPDGSRMLFVTAEEPSATLRAQIDREGIVYDETIHGVRSFTQKNRIPPSPQQVWLWRRGEKQAERVEVDWSPVGVIGRYCWGPDGHFVAMDYVPAGGPNLNMTNHIGVLTFDPHTGKPQAFAPKITTAAANRNPQWHPSNGSLVYASTGDPQRYYSVQSVPRILRPNESHPATVSVDGEWFFLSNATFDGAGDSLLFEYEDNSRSTLYRVPVSGGRARAVAGGAAHFSSFHFSRAKDRAACIRQAFTEPPEIALVDVKTGTEQVLTRLNPEFQSIRLRPAIERRWRNRHGKESNGFLILPDQAGRGRPVPLLVIQYAVSNKFTTQAQWMTSYPAQHFADAGFAVLLHNYPRELGWDFGDFHGAALSQAYNPLASLEAAVGALVDEGIADARKKGILGWSFGAWLAEMAITQSDLFQAASAGEGGLNNAGQYWVTGSSAMQRYLDGFFGGPPFGETYKNYQQLAPALNAHRVKAPLLREYGPDVGVQSMELYMALRRLRKPVEQIIYPGAPHVFSLPSHRKASMERNLDWFRFWLQEYEDPAPRKKPQYERWRKLQQQRHDP